MGYGPIEIARGKIQSPSNPFTYKWRATRNTSLNTKLGEVGGHGRVDEIMGHTGRNDARVGMDHDRTGGSVQMGTALFGFGGLDQ